MNATPFSAPNISEIKLSHRGERCTFEAILEGLSPRRCGVAATRLIVRAADVKGQETDAPEGVGLRAVASGFVTPENDGRHFTLKCYTAQGHWEGPWNLPQVTKDLVNVY